MGRPKGSTNSKTFKRKQPSAAEQARRTARIRQVAALVVAAADQWKRQEGI